LGNASGAGKSVVASDGDDGDDSTSGAVATAADGSSLFVYSAHFDNVDRRCGLVTALEAVVSSADEEDLKMNGDCSNGFTPANPPQSNQACPKANFFARDASSNSVK
jgi:hypothetical protein